MDDTIYRQDAFDALNGCTEIFLNNLPPTIDRADAVEAIKALPSAQPEQPEWVQAVERWYNKALCNPCIHKPFAWALYQVWKEYDNEG